MSLITGKNGSWFTEGNEDNEGSGPSGRSNPIRVIRAIRGQSPLFRVIPCRSVVPPRPRFVCFVCFAVNLRPFPWLRLCPALPLWGQARFLVLGGDLGWEVVGDFAFRYRRLQGCLRSVSVVAP
jgi:hypothetical protein